MSRKKGILGVLENLDLIQTDGTPSEPAATDPATPPPVSSAPIPAAPNAPLSTPVDAGMVAKIRGVVTAATHAPRLASFLSNLETAKAAFPNDERSAVSAALAFSKLTSADIRDELTKAVAAAIIETEGKIKNDISQRREQLATELDAEAERHRSDISSLDTQIKTLQGQMSTAQAALSKIDSTRAQRTAAITGDESTAFASLAAVKTELASLSNLLPA